MRRGPQPKPIDQHLKNVGLKVQPEVKKELATIVAAEKRKEGDLARAMFMRGLEAYRRDKELFKPIQVPDFLRRYLFDFAVLIERSDSMPLKEWEEILKKLIDELIQNVRKHIDGSKLSPPAVPPEQIRKGTGSVLDAENVHEAKTKLRKSASKSGRKVRKR